MSATERHTTAGYEATDANPRALTALGAGLALLLVVSMAVCWWLLQLLGTDDVTTEHPMTGYRTGPEGPLLQTSPTAEIEAQKREEHRQLDTYGWIDRQNGIVHIPIERAMALTLERGLPTTTPAEETGR